MSSRIIQSHREVERKKSLSLIFSLLAPGLGHLYLGEGSKGVVYYLIYLLLISALPILPVILPLDLIVPFFYLVIFAVVFHYVLNIVTTLLQHKKKEKILLKRYQHPVIYGAIVLSALSLVSILILADSKIYGIVKVHDDNLSPSLFENDKCLVINKNIFSNISEGMVIVYSDNDKKSLGRVIFIPDENRFINAIEGTSFYQLKLSDIKGSPDSEKIIIEQRSLFSYPVFATQDEVKKYFINASGYERNGKEFVVGDDRRNVIAVFISKDYQQIDSIVAGVILGKKINRIAKPAAVSQ